MAARLAGVENAAAEGRTRDHELREQLALVMASMNTISQQLEAQNRTTPTITSNPMTTPELRATSPSGTSAPLFPPIQPERDLKVAAPEPFTGNRSKLRSFLAQLDIVFILNPNRFCDDRTRILYTVSLLREGAFNWIEPRLRAERGGEHIPELRSYTQFIKELERMFGDIDAQAMAERKLEKLRQTSSARHYVSEFRQAASHLAWGDEALTYKFYSGLKDAVKDCIAEYGRPTEITQLMELAVRIDDRIYERFLEKKSSNGDPRQTRTNPQQTYAPDVMDWQASATSSGPKGPLSEEERNRRRTLGLCFYCASKDHMRRNCPDRLRIRSTTSGPTSANATLPSSTSTRSHTPTTASGAPSISATSHAIEFELLPPENE